jgi:imidazolonepropionase-like amidohydrolase
MARVVFPLLAVLAFAGGPSSRDAVTAIVHGTIVPMDAERVLLAHTILIRDGRIAWIGPDSEAEVPAGARVIDAAGAWILPGLADMHVHAGEEDFGAFLANGVTTIREMNGTSEHLEWREEAREGRLTAPTLIVTGPLIAGEEQRWRHALAQTRRRVGPSFASRRAWGLTRSRSMTVFRVRRTTQSRRPPTARAFRSWATFRGGSVSSACWKPASDRSSTWVRSRMRSRRRSRVRWRRSPSGSSARAYG